MADASTGDGIALHAARVRAGADLPLLPLHGADAAERPRRRDPDVVAAVTQLVERALAETLLDDQRTLLDAARVERRDQVVGVPLGCVDRLLQVQPAVDVTEEDMERPLFLLIAAGRPPREPRLAVAQCEARRQRRPRPLARRERRRQPLLEPEHLRARAERPP